MDKNRIRALQLGDTTRMSYSKINEVLEMPNLIEIQKSSYQWFITDGLKEVFDDISPIEDFNQSLSLEFVDFQIARDDIKYTIEECKERDATYAAPLKVKVRLNNKETGEISEHEIFMGDMPLMTETGTFVINGAERVIVSQLVRSPGIYFTLSHDKLGKELYQGISKCIVSPDRILHYRKFNETNSFENKVNTTGIRYNEKLDVVEFGKNFCMQFRLKPIRQKDTYLKKAMGHRVKYCRIVRKPFGNDYRYFVQLVMEGTPPVKPQLHGKGENHEQDTAYRSNRSFR